MLEKWHCLKLATADVPVPKTQIDRMRDVLEVSAKMDHDDATVQLGLFVLSHGPSTFRAESRSVRPVGNGCKTWKQSRFEGEADEPSVTVSYDKLGNPRTVHHPWRRKAPRK